MKKLELKNIELGLNAKATLRTWETFTIEGKVFDFNAELTHIWIETSEDIYCVEAENVEIFEAKEEKKAKISGKMEMEKFVGEDYRTLTFYPSIKSNDLNEQELWNVFENIIEAMENELDVQFSRCPEEYAGFCGDSFDIEYSHKDMAKTKKDVMTAWKTVKKELGIR